MDCIFCKIINKQIPAKIIFENENILAFEDIAPKAPVHNLIIPKLHIPTLNDLEEKDSYLIGEIALLAKKLAKDYQIADNGYRLVSNCNAMAGQTVFHIHFHLLGGRDFSWPPG